MLSGSTPRPPAWKFSNATLATDYLAFLAPCRSAMQFRTNSARFRLATFCCTDWSVQNTRSCFRSIELLIAGIAVWAMTSGLPANISIRKASNKTGKRRIAALRVMSDFTWSFPLFNTIPEFNRAKTENRQCAGLD
jgi:hypothetical protein